MNKQAFLSFILMFTTVVSAQIELKSDKLFQDQTPLKIKLSYSNKDLNKNTNDSTFINTTMAYWQEGKWSEIDVRLRARGNFRRSQCYFPPVKMKIKKNDYEGTLFDGNKTMKLVLPCKIESENNDNVLQEFIAYKMYEKISPYHFNTRRVDITFSEIKGNKTNEFELVGFLIEDDKLVAKRHEGKVFERFIHPMAMNHLTSVQNAFFQFLLGNTDFSVAYQHNGKLLYVDKDIIPLPYDFDMSGWVNPSYATVNKSLGIQSVQERKYRGFKRDDQYFYQVRDEFLEKKTLLMDLVASFENDFSDPREYQNMLEFMNDFFEIIQDDKQFEKRIVAEARSK